METLDDSFDEPPIAIFSPRAQGWRASISACLVAREAIVNADHWKHIAVMVKEAALDQLTANRRLPPENSLAMAARRLHHDAVDFIEEIRSEEHTSELQSLRHLVCRLLLE